jgi:hypothetical protein
MPYYDFACERCGTVLENQFLRITHLPDEKPECCDEPMNYHITTPPMVHWTDPVIEPFRNPAASREDKDAVITSKRQRREFMVKNDLVDANDFIPPTPREQAETHAEVVKSIEAVTPTKEQKDQMRSDGFNVDILE